MLPPAQQTDRCGLLGNEPLQNLREPLQNLRRLLAAPWLTDVQDADDEAIRRALPTEDEAIIGLLMELHEGKVPESAVGISAKVTG